MKKKKKNKKKLNKKGFSLIELIVVVALLGIIMAMATTNGFGLLDRSKQKISTQNQQEILRASNLFVELIEGCDDEIDKEMINKIGYINCKHIQKKYNSGKLVTTGFLLNKIGILSSYNKDDDIKISYKKNNDNEISPEILYTTTLTGEIQVMNKIQLAAYNYMIDTSSCDKAACYSAIGSYSISKLVSSGYLEQGDYKNYSLKMNGDSIEVLKKAKNNKVPGRSIPAIETPDIEIIDYE